MMTRFRLTFESDKPKKLRNIARQNKIVVKRDKSMTVRMGEVLDEKESREPMVKAKEDKTVIENKEDKESKKRSTK